MKNFIVIAALLSTSACVAKPEPKVNILTDEYREVKVEAPACPDWTGGDSVGAQISMRNFETQHSHSNYACATMTNYGKMIADPMDMITGKSSDFYDGQTTANAVNATRNAAAE